MNVLSRPSNENVCITDRTCRMTMSWESHLCFRLAVKRCDLWPEYKLISFIHWCRRQIEIASANHENSRASANLHQLEVVREIIHLIPLVSHRTVRGHIVDLEFIYGKVTTKHENGLWILVKDVNDLGRLAFDCRFKLDYTFWHFALLHHLLLKLWFWDFWLFINILALFDMLEEAFVLEILFAARAVKLENF